MSDFIAVLFIVALLASWGGVEYAPHVLIATMVVSLIIIVKESVDESKMD